MCFILSFQAVSAAEIDNNSTQDSTLAVATDVNSTSNDLSTYSLPDSNGTLLTGSGSGGSFSDLESDVIIGGEIHLTGNYTYSSSDTMTEGITINQDTTIIGDGNIVIDAKGKTRIFNIASGITVTISGITFANANSSFVSAFSSFLI